jgi:hypothetical protein
MEGIPIEYYSALSSCTPLLHFAVLLLPPEQRRWQAHGFDPVAHAFAWFLIVCQSQHVCIAHPGSHSIVDAFVLSYHPPPSFEWGTEPISHYLIQVTIIHPAQSFSSLHHRDGRRQALHTNTPRWDTLRSNILIIRFSRLHSRSRGDEL